MQCAEAAVLRLINVTLNDNQFDALVSFTFNLGAGNLQSSTLRRLLNRGDYHAIPDQFNRWVYASGTKSRGLVRRRAMEAKMFMS